MIAQTVDNDGASCLMTTEQLTCIGKGTPTHTADNQNKANILMKEHADIEPPQTDCRMEDECIVVIVTACMDY